MARPGRTDAVRSAANAFGPAGRTAEPAQAQTGARRSSRPAIKQSGGTAGVARVAQVASVAQVATVAKALDIPVDKVIVHVTFLGGMTGAYEAATGPFAGRTTTRRLPCGQHRPEVRSSRSPTR